MSHYFHHVPQSSAQIYTKQHRTAQHEQANTAQHSTAQHSTAQHSTAQHRHKRCTDLERLDEDRLCQPGRAVVGPLVVVGLQRLLKQHGRSTPEA